MKWKSSLKTHVNANGYFTLSSELFNSFNCSLSCISEPKIMIRSEFPVLSLNTHFLPHAGPNTELFVLKISSGKLTQFVDWVNRRADVLLQAFISFHPSAALFPCTGSSDNQSSSHHRCRGSLTLCGCTTPQNRFIGPLWNGTTGGDPQVLQQAPLVSPNKAACTVFG